MKHARLYINPIRCIHMWKETKIAIQLIFYVKDEFHKHEVIKNS